MFRSIAGPNTDLLIKAGSDFQMVVWQLDKYGWQHDVIVKVCTGAFSSGDL